jgi:ubiquitin-protein ligase
MEVYTMACLPNARLQNYYENKLKGKRFFDELLFCVPCDLHFSVNLIDPNGHGIVCPKCKNEDQQSLINIGTVEVKIIEILNEENCFTDFNSKDGSIYLEEENTDKDILIEPNYTWYGLDKQ